jgi:acyl-coenzyme A thioesterase PaaI-like protein
VDQEALQDKAPEAISKCWGCGRNNEHGLQIKSYWTGEEAVCTWKPQDYHLAFPGILNGGIIAALIDCHCMATAGASFLQEKGIEIGENMKEGIITGSLFIHYLKPTPINYPVTLRARVKEINGRKITIFCELYSKDKLCVTGEAVAIKIKT